MRAMLLGAYVSGYPFLANKRSMGLINQAKHFRLPLPLARIT
jgi:hypothetical protein